MPYLALILTVLFCLFFLGMVGNFTLKSWQWRGRAFRDRWELLTGTVTAIAICAIAAILINWFIAPGLVWASGIALLALGIGGAIPQWQGLPWFANGSPRPGRIVHIAADLLTSVAILVIALA